LLDVTNKTLNQADFQTKGDRSTDLLFLLAVDSESANSFLACHLFLTCSMFASERSALARELRKPLPRPRDVSGQRSDPPPELFRTSSDTSWLLPFAIVPNTDFLPRLLHDFYDFCEDHPDRGNDPLLLAGIQLARDDCAFTALEDSISNIDFLAGVIFPSVNRALRALEQNTGLRRAGEFTHKMERVSGVHMLWKDGTGSEMATRAVFQANSPKVGLLYFSEMDQLAQIGADFNTRGQLFFDAKSILFNVSSYSYI
jgi:hypothetical protein